MTPYEQFSIAIHAVARDTGINPVHLNHGITVEARHFLASLVCELPPECAPPLSERLGGWELSGPRERVRRVLEELEILGPPDPAPLLPRRAPAPIVYPTRLFHARWEAAQEAVVAVTGVPYDALLGLSRKAREATARALFWTLLLEDVFPHMTLAFVGDVFGRTPAAVQKGRDAFVRPDLRQAALEKIPENLLPPNCTGV